MKGLKRCLISLISVLIISAFCLPSIAGETITITGVVDRDFQVVGDDKQVYEVAENPEGDALVELIGSKVKVTGEVDEIDGVKVITVKTYQVITE